MLFTEFQTAELAVLERGQGSFGKRLTIFLEESEVAEDQECISAFQLGSKVTLPPTRTRRTPRASRTKKKETGKKGRRKERERKKKETEKKGRREKKGNEKKRKGRIGRLGKRSRQFWETAHHIPGGKRSRRRSRVHIGLPTRIKGNPTPHKNPKSPKSLKDGKKGRRKKRERKKKGTKKSERGEIEKPCSLLPGPFHLLT